MQIFVYEFFTGGGDREVGRGGTAPSLLAEAAAMIRAAATDFSLLPSVRLVTTRNSHLPPIHPPGCHVIEIGDGDNEPAVFVRLAKESDWTLLIAPETDGVLLQRAKLVESTGGRLLSPGSVVIEIAANKQKTADVLNRAKVPTPHGMLLTADVPTADCIRFPAVIKPLDGCGSQGVRLVRDADEFEYPRKEPGLRIEEFVAGLPVSVSVLCGPVERLALPACEQRLSTNGQFAYLGGRLQLPSELDQRARRLALQAIGALPPTIGYLGVDLVLGEAVDGSGDRVIEINPRLTTSYVGLRTASRSNLAAAMLAIAQGETPDLCFGEQSVEFTAAGKILQNNR